MSSAYTPTPWKAEATLTLEQAARLIDSQFSEFAPARLELMGEGYDNWAYLVNDAWIFRFPRRQIAVGLLKREVEVLPRIGPELPLPIPLPCFVGVPEGNFPWPFAGYRMVPGQTACSAGLDPSTRGLLGPEIGRFLKRLHSIQVSDAERTGQPPDPFAKTDLEAVRLHRLEVLERVLVDGLPVDADEVREGLATLAKTAPWDRPACWIHGDLYARHLLVDHQGALAGVLDWGDVALGDPALDLSIAWSLLPPAARPAFWSSYGKVDPATRDRARFRALGYGVVLLEYGREVSDPALIEIAGWALDGALS